MRTGYYRVREALLEALEGGENGAKMFVLGGQGNPNRIWLFGLGLFENRNALKQNEVITMEVYESKDDEYDYFVRFTRDGEFISYPPCQDFYTNRNTELCPLEVLLNDETYGFSDAVSVQEWANVCVNAVTDCLCGLCDE